MDLKEKRKELKKWLNSLDEETLLRVDEIKKSISNQIVIYTIDGKGLTSKEYENYINNISLAVDKGEKTYNSEEIRSVVLRNRS
jgi:hypothetical protein